MYNIIEPLNTLYTQTARHKTNANYEKLVSDTVEKRVAKNLLCNLC